jgi:hypothetical protein
MKLSTHIKEPMVQIRRPGDNFCAFETLSKMAGLKSFFALMKKRQSFCYPTVQGTKVSKAPYKQGVFGPGQYWAEPTAGHG